MALDSKRDVNSKIYLFIFNYLMRGFYHEGFGFEKGLGFEKGRALPRPRLGSARLGSARNENILGSARLGSERKYFGLGSARLGTKIFSARLGSARNENILGVRLGSERKYFGLGSARLGTKIFWAFGSARNVNILGSARPRAYLPNAQPRPKSAALCRTQFFRLNQTYDPAPAEECGAVSNSVF